MCRGCAQRKYDSSLIRPGWKQRELGNKPHLTLCRAYWLQIVWVILHSVRKRCVCVCVRKRERWRENFSQLIMNLMHSNHWRNDAQVSYSRARMHACGHTHTRARARTHTHTLTVIHWQANGYFPKEWLERSSKWDCVDAGRRPGQRSRYPQRIG